MTQLLLFTVLRACFSLPSVAPSFLDLPIVPRADFSSFSTFSLFSRCAPTCFPIFSLVTHAFPRSPSVPSPAFELSTVRHAFSPIPQFSRFFSDLSTVPRAFYRFPSVSPLLFLSLHCSSCLSPCLSVRPLRFRSLHCSSCHFCLSLNRRCSILPSRRPSCHLSHALRVFFSFPILALFLVSLFCSASQTVTQLLLFTVRRACFSLPSVASSFLDLSTVPRAGSSPFSPFSRCTCTCVPIFSLFLAPFFRSPSIHSPSLKLSTVRRAFFRSPSVPPLLLRSLHYFSRLFSLSLRPPRFFLEVLTVSPAWCLCFDLPPSPFRSNFVSPLLFQYFHCSWCLCFDLPPSPRPLSNCPLFVVLFLLSAHSFFDLFTVSPALFRSPSASSSSFRPFHRSSSLFPLSLHPPASFSISSLFVVPFFASLSVHPRLLQSLHCSWCLYPRSLRPRASFSISSLLLVPFCRLSRRRLVSFSISSLLVVPFSLPLRPRASFSIFSVSPAFFRSPLVCHFSSDLLTVSPAFFRSPFVSPLLFQSSHCPSCPSCVSSVVDAIL